MAERYAAPADSRASARDKEISEILARKIPPASGRSPDGRACRARPTPYNYDDDTDKYKKAKIRIYYTSCVT